MKIIPTSSKPHGGTTLPTLPFTKNKPMITLTEFTSHSVQPALLEKHSTTLKWLSATIHWKSELAFFQKTLKNQMRTDLPSDVKREFEYFDNQFVYLTEEAIEDLRKKLRNQESRLARMFETKSEWDAQYYKEHDSLMEDATKLSELITKLIDSHRRWITKLQGHNGIA